MKPLEDREYLSAINGYYYMISVLLNHFYTRYDALSSQKFGLRALGDFQK